VKTRNRGFRREKMADPSVYSYPSPLEGWDLSTPLPDEKAEDGKSESQISITTFPNP
jgi:DOPA 4,5-dioxygenase